MDLAAVLLDDSLGDGQSQSDARFLGGEIGLEYLRSVLGRDPLSLVGEGKPEELASRCLGGAQGDSPPSGMACAALVTKLHRQLRMSSGRPASGGGPAPTP